MKPEELPKELFDNYAQNYDELLNDSLSVSGETRDYFADGRVTWLQRSLGRLGARSQVVMDYGCGTGATIPYLAQVLAPDQVVGLDVSSASLTEAKKIYTDPRFNFHLAAEYKNPDTVDVAYSCCVFHHIPVPQRPDAFKYIYDSLKPGGLFALWEHNPWNPATQWIVSQCEFDRDAVLLFPAPTRELLAQVGFEVLSTNYLFIFPALLKAFRPLEKYFCDVPLGAQYQILCQKPG